MIGIEFRLEEERVAYPTDLPSVILDEAFFYSVEIDDVVLRKVCRALARWKEEGKTLYPVSVNLSRERLYEENLIPHLVQIVDESGIPHHLIDFELTESATYENTEHMLGILGQLRDKGFQG